MRILLASLIAIGLLSRSASAETDPSRMPAPPSVALHPSPKPANSPVEILVNVIPANAKYVIAGEISMGDLSLSESNAAEVGAHLSAVLDQVPPGARQHGVNLIVLLGQEHGVAIPLRQTKQPLILRRRRPVLTMILFDWDPSTGISEKEKHIRFVIGPGGPSVPPHPKDPLSATSVGYSMALKVNTARVSKSFWTYANISRFVKDAVSHDMDTIAIESCDDYLAEDVWLPGCDQPIRISNSKPELKVKIYKRKA